MVFIFSRIETERKRTYTTMSSRNNIAQSSEHTTSAVSSSENLQPIVVPQFVARCEDASMPKYVLNIKLGADAKDDQTQRKTTPVELGVVTLKFELGKGSTEGRGQTSTAPASNVLRRDMVADGAEDGETNRLETELIEDIVPLDRVNVSALRRPITIARRHRSLDGRPRSWTVPLSVDSIWHASQNTGNVATETDNYLDEREMHSLEPEPIEDVAVAENANLPPPVRRRQFRDESTARPPAVPPRTVPVKTVDVAVNTVESIDMLMRNLSGRRAGLTPMRRRRGRMHVKPTAPPPPPPAMTTMKREDKAAVVQQTLSLDADGNGGGLMVHCSTMQADHDGDGNGDDDGTVNPSTAPQDSRHPDVVPSSVAGDSVPLTDDPMDGGSCCTIF